MPAPAYKNVPKADEAASARSDETWYGAFSPSDRSAQVKPDEIPRNSSSETIVSDPLDTLTPSDIPGPHMRRSDEGATLPALLSLQHAELDRLVRDNGRLMDRIETLLQIQGREQVLRQQLQNQADRITEQMKQPVPAATLEAVHQQARAGVTEEIKPVLMAILDALERFADKADAKKVTATQHVEPPAPLDPYDGEDYGKLPAILTRPLTELMSDGGVPRRPVSEAANRRPSKSPFHKRKRTRPTPANTPASRPTSTSASTSASTPENNDGPASFTWSTVFTS